MARCLFTVEETFLIRGRGVVTLPGIVPREGERFRAGDPIVIKRPDGSRLDWTIGGLEMFSTPPRQTDDVPILLVGLTKDDVPIDSEVWSVDRA